MKKVVLILLSTLFISSVALALDVPNHYDWVNDFANVIEDSVEIQLNERIKKYEEQTSNEITVVTISSLEGDNLEDFSIRLAEEWKVGKKDKDNGIILLFAIEEKRVRLEVGYGLEGVINDAKAGRILDDYVVEYRDKGDYTNASKNGVEGIIENLGEEPWSEEMRGEEFNPLILLFILLGIIGLVVFLSWAGGGFYGSSGSSFGGGSSGSGFGGGGFGGGGASR